MDLAIPYYNLPATHYDIANILHLKYQSSFICSNIKNNDWFEFKGHTSKKN